MFNPFSQKVIAYNFTAQGLKRWFKVRTADGDEYETVRKDRIWVSEYWPKKFLAKKQKVKANDILAFGIKEGIWIDGGTTCVQPISVVQYKEEVIQLLETWSQTYRINPSSIEWENDITAVKIS